MTSEWAGNVPIEPIQDRAQKKRNELLDAGKQLFTQNGYHNVTSKQIAALAGVSIGTFYRYFSDKRQLLIVLLEDHLRHLMPKNPSWLQQDTEQGITNVIYEFHSILQSLPFWNAIKQLSVNDAELKEVVQQVHAILHSKIIENLQEARQLGFVWNDIDLTTAAWTVLAIVEQAEEYPALSQLEEGRQQLAKLIIRMIGPLGTENLL